MRRSPLAPADLLNVRGRDRRRLLLRAAAAAAAAAFFCTMSASAASDGLAGPTRPGKLKVRSISATSIQVSWAASHGSIRVAGYRVYVNGALRASVRSRSLQVRRLRCGTKYLLAVSAYDSAGRASPSRSRSVRLRCAPAPSRKAPQCRKTTSASLAGAIRNASAGTTICLSSGSYGPVTFRSLSKSSDVTVRPAPGANVTIGQVDLQAVRHLRFTGLGGSMSVDGAEVDDINTRPNCSSHLTFDHLRFTRGMDIYPRCANMAILVDHDNLNNLRNVEGGDGRLNVQAMDEGPKADQGITISNSTFNGGCSKGIQILGGAYGVQVLNNEFAHLSQSGCDPIHIGGIQIYGGSHIHLKGNYFHDNGDSAGGLSMPADGGRNVLVEDNVWVCTCAYPWSIQAAGTQGSRFVHNTFAGGGGIHFYVEQGWVAAGNLVRDNVFTDPSNGITWDSRSSNYGTNDHNLNAGVRGIGDISGRPVFVGGKHPTSFAGYRLARHSRGKRAASDGGDIGIRRR